MLVLSPVQTKMNNLKFNKWVLSGLCQSTRTSLKMVNVAVEAVSTSSKLVNNSKLQGTTSEVEVYQPTSLALRLRKTLLARVFLDVIVAMIISIFSLFFFVLKMIKYHSIQPTEQGQEEYLENNKRQRRYDAKIKRNKRKEDKIKAKLSEAKVIKEKKDIKKHGKITQDHKMESRKKYSFHSNEYDEIFEEFNTPRYNRVFRPTHRSNNRSRSSLSYSSLQKDFEEFDSDEVSEVDSDITSYSVDDGPKQHIGKVKWKDKYYDIKNDLHSRILNGKVKFDSTFNPIFEVENIYRALSYIKEFKTSISLKDFELFVINAYACYNSIDIPHLISILMVYSHNYMSSSYSGILKDYLKELFVPGEEVVNQSGETLTKIKDIIKSWKDIKNSRFVDSIKRLIAVTVASGMCKAASIPFGKTMFNNFYKKTKVGSVSRLDFIEQFFETTIYVYEKFEYFYHNGDFMSLFYDQECGGETYEKEYSTLISTLTLLHTGNLSKNDFDEHSYENRVDKLISTTETIISSTSGIERKIFAERLLMLKRTKVAILDYHKSMTLREAPFSFLLFGGSGVGKSTMLPKIINALLQANNMEVNKDLVVTLQASDAFQSEYRTKHTVVILDDIANANPDHTQVNPNDIIINFCNNIPAYALNPIAELKGKILIAPKFFIGTTNNKSLFANIYSTEPISILRRFNYTISVSLKPEFMCDGRLDRTLVSGYGVDAWNFTVEIPYSLNNAGSTVKSVAYRVVNDDGIEMRDVSLGRLIYFLSKQSRIHFAQQSALLATNNEAFGTQTCEHHSYEDICPLCLSEQGNYTDLYRLILGRWLKIPKFIFWLASKVSFSHNFLRTAILIKLVESFYFDYIVQMVFVLVGFISIIFAEIVNKFLHMTTIVYLVFIMIHFSLTITFILVAYVELTKKYILTMSTKTVHEFWKRTQPVRKHCKNLIRFMSIVTALYALYKFYKRWQTNEQGAAFSVPLPREDEQVNVWKTPIVKPILTCPELTNMTLEQVKVLISKNIGHATFKNDQTGKATKCDIFPLKSNYWLAPWHVLKRDYNKITIIRDDPEFQGPNLFDRYIGNNIMQRIGKTDLGIIFLASGGDTRDLRKLFPLTHSMKPMPGNLIYKDELANMKYDAFSMKPHLLRKDDTEYRGFSYNCNFNTFNGLCMATIVSMSKFPVILGFHLAGVTDTPQGICQTVLLSEIDETLEKMKSLSVVFQTASEVNVDFNVLDMGITHSESIHKKSPSRFLSEGASLIHLGSHSGMRRKFTSEVVKTIISDSVEQILGVPCKYGPPKNIGTYLPWQQSLEKMTHLKSIDPVLLELAYDDFHDKIFDHLHKHESHKDRIHPLPNVNVISGVDGIYGLDQINLSASSGWPYNVKKSKLVFEVESEGTGCSFARDCSPEFWAKVDAMEEELSQGKRIYLIHRTNLKDEATRFDKDKVRTFAGTPFEGLALVRRYFLTICKYIMEHSELFECAVGVNYNGPGWTKLTNTMLKFGPDRVIAGDYKDFDSSMPCEVTLCAMKLLIEIAKWAGFSPRQITIMEGIATEICMPVYEYNGEFIKVNGSNPSGHSLTVFMNNIVNSIYLRVAYYGIYNRMPPGKFAHNVAAMCYGDDNKMSVRLGVDAFNHTNIAAFLKRFGIIFTMADKTAESVPFINNEDCSFLKRKSIWSEEYQRYLAPIEEASIFKQLHCGIKSKFLTPEEQASECILNALREYFHYGREKYDEMRLKLLMVVAKHELKPYMPEGILPRYEYEEERFLKGVMEL